MIQLPHRAVTRFFIPLIDVLILLFCIFLLLPFVSKQDGEEGGERRCSGAGTGGKAEVGATDGAVGSNEGSLGTWTTNDGRRVVQLDVRQGVSVKTKGPSRGRASRGESQGTRRIARSVHVDDE